MMPDWLPDWWIYPAMPLIAAFIGWITKVAAVEMMFRPLEFKGIPPYLGWQGVIPRSAERMANISVNLLMNRLIDPKEIISEIDVDEMMVTLHEPMSRLIDQMTRDLMREYQPTFWEALPEQVKQYMINHIEAEVPKMMRGMLDEMQDRVDDVIDIRALAIDALVRDKALTNRLVRTAGKDAFHFIIMFGIPSGFALGVVQAIAWYYTKNPWILPGFGALTGLVTDWLALQMIFRPVRKRRFGLVSWQGLFHAKRDKVTADYASLVANELLSPANMLEAMLNGPKSDRFLRLIDREMQSMIDAQSGPMKPLVVLAIGGDRYAAIKDRAVAATVQQMRENEELSAVASEIIDLQALVTEKMAQMTDEEYESLLRPAFKQDEWKLVVVGAVLGFLVGELQVHLLLE
ncbi:DUF445 domain-containing protein [Skermania piniformis]|uniref:DUF445 family protein n=1 Tax=Skermania pinensis TaxID=39122 RepID=A0ABX8SBN7_9ACTN|nr:DUF445 family protein [Skermania piniformis]QXQ15280.1 DUF445 family protein [Skermania piniformis]